MNTLVRGHPAGVSNEDNLLPEAVRALMRWWRDRHEIAHLSTYSDEMLKDVGISRSDIGWAVREGRRNRSRPAPETGSPKKGGPLEEK